MPERPTAGNPEVLVLLSGGVDSAACLDFFIDMGRNPCAMFIDYMQPARDKEWDAATLVAAHYRVELFHARWVGAVPKTSGEILGRNAFLVASAMMERPCSATGIAIGIHAGTHYSDCSPAFVQAMQQVIDTYSEGSVKLVAPFLTWTKSDIWAYANSHNVPVHLTYSCERGGNKPCGECLSCQDRTALNEFS